jgi:hypothetical protein
MAEFINYQKKYKKLTIHLAPLKASNSPYLTPEQRTVAAAQFTKNENKEFEKSVKKPAPPPPPPVPPTGMVVITL